MARSLSFGSTAYNLIRAINTRFRFGFVTNLTLLYTVSRRLIMQKACSRAHKALPHFVDAWFQVLFHSPPGVLFAFPSRYWFTIGHRRVFSLGRWPSRIQTWFHVSGPTRDTHRALQNFAYGTVTHCGSTFQLIRLFIRVSSRVPQHRPVNRTVLATPLSLAATKGISVDFFSSGYWDVSLPQVSLQLPMYSVEDNRT